MNSWKFIARNKYDDCRQFLLDYKEGDENLQALARVAVPAAGIAHHVRNSAGTNLAFAP